MLLALVRYSTFVFLFPVFNRSVPALLKAGLAALMAILVPAAVSEEIDTTGALVAAAVQEIGVGLLLSLVVILVFGVIYFAGQLVDVPMGFGLVSIFDPQTGMQLPVFSQFFYLMSVLIFLGVDGHLWLFRALAQSYQLLPAGEFFSLAVTAETIFSLGQGLFSVGIKIALPVMGTLLLTDVSLGVVVRTVPQINIFVLGFPIKIFVGLVMVTLMLPFFVAVVSQLFAVDGYLFGHWFALFSSGG